MSTKQTPEPSRPAQPDVLDPERLRERRLAVSCRDCLNAERVCSEAVKHVASDVVEAIAAEWAEYQSRTGIVGDQHRFACPLLFRWGRACTALVEKEVR